LFKEDGVPVTVTTMTSTVGSQNLLRGHAPETTHSKGQNDELNAVDEVKERVTASSQPSPPKRKLQRDDVFARREEEEEEEEREGLVVKKQRTDEVYAQDDKTKKVYVWDLDETLIIFQSLLSGAFAKQHGLDVATCEKAALEMEELIVQTAEKHFFFEELESDGDRVHIDRDDVDEDAISTSNNHHNAHTEKLYEAIKRVYAKTTSDVDHVFETEEEKRKWLKLRDSIESLTERWVSDGSMKCLSAVSNRDDVSANVIVTNSQLIAALVKLLLNGLAKFFPVQNVYSSSKVGKEHCFSLIQSRFPSAAIVVIGDGEEEETAADKFQDFQFWKIAAKRDLTSLATAINLKYM